MKAHALTLVVVLLIASTLFLSSAAIPAMAQQDTKGETTTATVDPEANLPYLFAVYAVTWIAFFAYLYYLSQRQQNLRREVEELREAMSEGRGEVGGSVR